MKYFQYIYIFLFGVCAFAQPVWQDDFSDGDFSSNPSWIGDVNNFRVQNAELQLYDTSLSGISWLSTASTAAFNGFWQFKVRLEFNPSTQNFAQAFIVSNNANVSGSVNGYFVRIGGTTNRRISLIRRSGTTNTVLVESVDNVVNTGVVHARIRVENNDGIWTLLYDTSNAALPNYISAGTAFDTTFRQSAYFGILCRYTSTRFDKMFFDDFSVNAQEYRDTIPPEVLSAVALSPQEVLVRYSKPVSNTALSVGNYFMSGNIGVPASAEFSSSENDEVRLIFTQSLQSNQIYSLQIEDVEDLSGNEIEKTTIAVAYVLVQAFDVVFNEIMADPTPVVGLPDAEFVELFNRLPVPVSLEGWRMMVNNTSIALGGMIPPDSFIVITRNQSVNLFPSGLNVSGVNMSSTQLPNSGARLSLYSPQNQLIHSVTYSDQWYESSVKRNGGWSLEQIDPTNFCGLETNWRESVNPSGGTPGRRNSVLSSNPDTTSLYISKISVPTPTQVRLLFNKPLHPTPAIMPDFVIKPDLRILSVMYDVNVDNSIIIDLIDPIKEGILYEIQVIDRPIDCQDRPSVTDIYPFGLPLEPLPGDVILNELLFNQPTDGSKFVEIVNISEKILDISKLKLANLAGSQISNIRDISAEPLLLLPKSYLVITPSIRGVVDFYQTNCMTCFIQSSLPTMNIRSGNVALLNAGLDLLDYFEYNENMHSPMVRNPKGVSLERVSFASPINDSRFWMSASQQSGFATPGHKNSQQLPDVDAFSDLFVQPKTFSPNNDGYNDFVQIHFQLDKNNYIGDLSVIDLFGNQIKTIASSELLADAGNFIWDGTDNFGRRVSMGIYVIVFEVFHPEGGRKVLKTSVGLIY